MENIKRETRTAWTMAEKYECYVDLVNNLDNGTWPNNRLSDFLKDVYGMDCNTDNFDKELNHICDKHKI